MGDLLHLLSTRQPLPAHLARAHPLESAAATQAARLAHYTAQADLAKLLAALRDELGMADQLLQLALGLLTTEAKFELARQAGMANLTGPSGGTTRKHERAAVLQRARNTSGRG
jgi:hypothetical protein